MSKFDELEKLYEEKLRLASPAEHWEKLETRYLKSGRIGTGLLVALVAATAVVVGRLLYYPPAAWTQEALTPAVVKGAVILTVGISVTVYLMHIGVRHVTSSYHLARDARERLQLTHMFLALLRDKAIEPKEREIVLSALFSRSDTGLLRHDSTPTLPSPFGSLLDAIKGGK